MGKMVWVQTHEDWSGALRVQLLWSFLFLDCLHRCRSLNSLKTPTVSFLQNSFECLKVIHYLILVCREQLITIEMRELYISASNSFANFCKPPTNVGAKPGSHHLSSTPVHPVRLKPTEFAVKLVKIHSNIVQHTSTVSSISTKYDEIRCSRLHLLFLPLSCHVLQLVATAARLQTSPPQLLQTDKPGQTKQQVFQYTR